MTKLVTKIKQSSRKLKQHHTHAVKHMHSQFKKRPLVTVLGILIVVGLLGAGSYAGVTQLQNANVNLKDITEKSEKKEQLKITEEIASVATPSPSPSPTPTPDINKGADLPGRTATYSPGCRGAGCPTANPNFSIITTRTIAVIAGTSVGPFTASTSDGSTVDWSTPQYNGGLGPNGYNLTSNRVGPSTEYYIRAEPSVAPGTYTLYMSAIKTSTQSLVKTTITVNVTPAPTTYPAPSTP